MTVDSFSALRAENLRLKAELAELTADNISEDLRTVERLLAEAFVGKATTIIGKGHIERWQRRLSSAIAALEAVAVAAHEKAAFLEDDWNPEAHVEVTLTISECRAVHAALHE